MVDTIMVAGTVLLCLTSMLSWDNLGRSSSLCGLESPQRRLWTVLATLSLHYSCQCQVELGDRRTEMVASKCEKMDWRVCSINWGFTLLCQEAATSDLG